MLWEAKEFSGKDNISNKAVDDGRLVVLYGSEHLRAFSAFFLLYPYAGGDRAYHRREEKEDTGVDRTAVVRFAEKSGSAHVVLPDLLCGLQRREKHNVTECKV